MVKPEFLGARGSNAGDDFHELWVLRQSLMLLEQDTDLTMITVEGLRAEDENGVPKDSWDGVDCAFYYGGDHIDSAKRIVIDQLKYSAANSEQMWTLARLIKSTNKKKDNSVISRLAKAFIGIKTKQSDIVESCNLIIRLISNQQIDPIVINELLGKSKEQSVRDALQTASGLNKDEFETFINVLDFSECGAESRFALEERVMITISEWTDDDARSVINDLLVFVRRLMMPEAKGAFITRQSILLQFGFSDPLALFPCPSVIKIVERLVQRDESRVIIEKMLSGSQRICLHGEGGCGKTTILQEIEPLLPIGSIMITFDCYGGGRYLDSDAYRHRPPDAFLQLTNDLARKLRIPLLVSRSSNIDYPKIFKKRLGKAAEVVSSLAQDALLVVVIDAADNSVTAANLQSPPERSFIHDFLSLGDLPKNVCFIVTTRTGRLHLLNLPHSFIPIEITGFNLNETNTLVKSIWDNAPDSWIDDFHYLSNGNPRVQRYALDYAGFNTERAIDYLRPNGKGLNQVFQDQLEHSRHKVGYEYDIKTFCSGLIGLPRPIPIIDLSIVTSMSESHIRDLCADLAPGIRLTNGLISFADEDFEQFIRAEADDQLNVIQNKIADHFISKHKTDAYSASHIAEALFVTGRGRDIIDLINTEKEPKAIIDPVIRREAQLKRLKIAMKVCREAGDTVDAIQTILIGAEALKTDEEIKHMLIWNPDLAANFAYDTSSRFILRNPEEIENHGPFLFHLMSADARREDSISVRERHRQIRAWLKRRAEYFEEQEQKQPGFGRRGWSIKFQDITAETDAILHIAGPKSALESLLRWSPRTIALQVISKLSCRLIIAGEVNILKKCITDSGISAPWNLFLQTPLALSGEKVDLSQLAFSLKWLFRRGLINLNKLRDSYNNENGDAGYFDLVLTSCEIVIAQGGDPTFIIPILEQIAAREVRRCDRLYTSKVQLIDFSLRAYTLLESMAGNKISVDTYLIDPPNSQEELEPKKLEQFKKDNSKKREELKEFIGPIIDFYIVRAQALIGLILAKEIKERLQKTINHYHDQEYRINRITFASEMKTRTILTITRLMAVPEFNRVDLLECINGIMNRSSFLNPVEIEIFETLALDRLLHQLILKQISDHAITVKETKTSSEEKIEALTRFSRLLLHISYKDSESLFKDAIEVAGDVNEETIHEIELFAPLSECAVESMDFQERRMLAYNLAIIVGDAAIRLEGHRHFPWMEISQVIATMDISFALAVTARWEDSDLVDREIFLQSILEIALSHHEMTPVQISALSSLLDSFDSNFINQIVDEVISRKGNFDKKKLAEYLAREELLRFGNGTRQQLYEKLRLLQTNEEPSFWLEQLLQATKFHANMKYWHDSIKCDGDNLHPQSQSKSNESDILDTIDWEAHRFITSEDIKNVIEQLVVTLQSSSNFVSTSTILDRIGSVVSLSDRSSHLDALCSLKSSKVSNYALIEAITGRLNDWYESPAVNRWCRERLIHVVIDLLPGFSHMFRKNEFSALLGKTGLSNQQICSALLEAMERHVETLDARTVYEFVELIGRYCLPSDVAKIIMHYAERLVQRIPISERDEWDIGDIPSDLTSSLARFLYAYMGDIDVRIRWRAAHALRYLVYFGNEDIIDRIVQLYNRITEVSFRKPDAPFYWLNARLWLMITLDRIADETPSSIKDYGLWLLEIVSNEEFPHVLIRKFAKDVVSKLIEGKWLTLNSIQLDELNRANSSVLPRKKGKKAYNISFDMYSQGHKERRFHFNSTDTLPYWYSNALSIFADVNQNQFLDIAESWIIDRWGIVKENLWHWDKEPRIARFSKRSYSSMDHSHGSLPIIERFWTYLEWHAMWCTTGQLMQTYALRRMKDEDYNNFENWMNRNSLSLPPLWLSDLRSPKPLEDRFWLTPNDIDSWVENIKDNDFLIELALSEKSKYFIIDSYYDARSSEFRLSARVNTALVSPETASSLLRALQTTGDSWDYRIPPAGDELEINNPPFKLLGWLLDVEHHSGIDEGDPFRNKIHGIESCPSNKTLKIMNLRFVCDGQARWVDIKTGVVIFVYETWADNNDDDYGNRNYIDKTVISSSGWRLKVDKNALNDFLNKIGLDLIVEIEITRRNQDYVNSRLSKEKETRESRFDRVILLRRDGTVETTEGSIGTW